MRTGIVDRDIWAICIWYNPHQHSYYYRLLTSCYFEQPGYKNSYDHELIMVIQVYKDIIQPRRLPLYQILLKRFISLLHRLDNKLSK